MQKVSSWKTLERLVAVRSGRIKRKNLKSRAKIKMQKIASV